MKKHTWLVESAPYFSGGFEMVDDERIRELKDEQICKLDCAYRDKSYPTLCSRCSRGKEDQFKAKRKPWYEQPSTFPCLCFVWGEQEANKVIRLIHKKLINFETDAGGAWRYARPLTLAEAAGLITEVEE